MRTCPAFFYQAPVYKSRVKLPWRTVGALGKFSFHLSREAINSCITTWILLAHQAQTPCCWLVSTQNVGGQGKKNRGACGHNIQLDTMHKHPEELNETVHKIYHLTCLISCRVIDTKWTGWWMVWGRYWSSMCRARQGAGVDVPSRDDEMGWVVMTARCA